MTSIFPAILRRTCRRAAIVTSIIAATGQASAALDWTRLADLPDPAGQAAPFAGIVDGGLLVAGGANFPVAMPWDGGAKIWHDTAWFLDAPGGHWREAGKLPRPLAYGVSIDTPGGLLCIGGSDELGHFPDCFVLRFENGELVHEAFPPLPRPLANMSGERIGNIAYIIGGTDSHEATTASRALFSIDLDDPSAGWREHMPIPGDGRMLAVAGTRGGALYVFSGTALHAGADGSPQRKPLADAWKYTPGTGWSQLADMPRPAIAAPSPALSIGVSHLFVIGGDDGASGHIPITERTGFTREILAYDTTTNTWTAADPLPEILTSPVTVPVVRWNGQFVIPSGEQRPGVRTPAVITAAPSAATASFGWINWTVTAAYLAGMIGVGWWFMKRQASATTEAYFRGGQRIPSWVAGLSIFATMLSALTFMGIPARAYQTDVSWYIGQLPILIIVPLVMFFYLPFFRKLDLTSAYEYLERRFNLPCRLFASLSFMLLHIGRIAIVLYLPALALAAVSDIDVITAILVIGVLCMIYTVIGGIEAVVWTDAIQAIVLMGGALLCLALATARIDGGLAGIATIAVADAKLFQSLSWTDFNIADGTTTAIVLFVAFFFNSLISYTSSQDVVQRYVTTRDIAAARQSLKLNMWVSVFGSLVFFALGVAIYAFYKSHPGRLDPAMAANDSILPYYIMHQLPAGVAGLLIAAIFAASQSTVSSSLNSVATAFIKDIDARLLRPGRSDKTYLRTAQLAVVVVGSISIAVAIWMAKANIESAFKTFNTLIGLTAGPLGGLFALGIFSRRATGGGAFAGALLGFATVCTLHFSPAPVTGLLFGFVGFAVSFIAGRLLGMVIPGGGDASLAWRPGRGDHD